MEKKKERLTPELIIKGKYISVEKSNIYKIQKLEWGEYTDVLYSFCNILALGVYIQEKDKYKVGKDKRIRLLGGIKWLATHESLRDLNKNNYTAIKKLTESPIVGEFASVYNTIGNVIPIWPGGNEFKGTCFIDGGYCYDIPDIFFRKHFVMEKVYIESILKKEISDVALARFELNANSNAPDKVKSILDIFEYSSLDEYFTFVRNIVNEIKTRNDELEKLC